MKSYYLLLNVLLALASASTHTDWRHMEPSYYKKPEGVTRIIVIGDSTSDNMIKGWPEKLK